MVEQRQKRCRGLVFTDRGFQKLRSKMKSYEDQEKSGGKFTFEELSEITGLAYNTVFKVLKREKGVDKRTLAKFFLVFDLELNSDDYTLLGLRSSHNCKRNVEWVNFSNTFDVSEFYGRTTELTTMKQWLVEDCCRLVTVYGMGGIGKTALSVKLVKEIEDKFDCVLWISLQKAPLVKQVLADIIQFLFDKRKSEIKSSNSIKTNCAELFNYLRLHRCLIVFDEIETIMQTGVYSGTYKEGYKDYGQLIRYMAEISHQSSFLLISRELPKEAAIFDGTNLPVRNIELNSLQQAEGLNFLQNHDFFGSTSSKNKLIKNYSGNPFALIKVTQKIKTVYGGNIHNFFQSNELLPNDIKNILNQHYQRLSIFEKKICHTIMTHTIMTHAEPITLLELQKFFAPLVSPDEIMSYLESLRRRSLIIIKDNFFILNPFFGILISII